MDKPLIIKLEEFESNLINIINQSELPAFMLREPMRNAYDSITTLAKKELEQAKKVYQESEQQNSEPSEN